MDAQMRRQFLYRLGLLGLCGALLCLWVAFDLPCLFRYLTGIPCISCGMSRAWLCALRLDLKAAFGYHPMFWSIPVLALLFLLTGAKPARWGKTVYALIALAFVVCYVIRLAAHFMGSPLV